MAEEKPLRFVSPDPVLALILAKREPKVIPKELNDWAIRWVADVGIIMRSRDYMAYTFALYGGMGIMSSLLRRIPDIALLDTFLKRLGFTE
ncbi:unnamed protein product [marine sediment metagenome]|uniref:Uncharacterized protein n=1 Tax=marine sediment metagenome TaxID=412755 RepID=X1K0A7_9ZZZZ